MSDHKEEAIKTLVRAGVKQELATKVVEHSGYEPRKIVNDPCRILEEYWIENSPVDFLEGATPTNVSELKRGLTALGFQEPLVNRTYENGSPSPGFIGHWDIFSWGAKLVEYSLKNDYF